MKREPKDHLERNNREFIFHDDDDRQAFLDIIAEVVALFNWRVHAWVIMGNHYHLMVSTPELTLSKGMHRLNQLYAQRSNWKYDRSGHLFQGRFKAHLVDKHAWMLELARYVVLNPVRAGMVERPEDYRWSSYRASAGYAPSPSLLSDNVPAVCVLRSSTSAEAGSPAAASARTSANEAKACHTEPSNSIICVKMMTLWPGASHATTHQVGSSSGSTQAFTRCYARRRIGLEFP